MLRLLLLFFVAVTHGGEPGIKVVVTESGLDFLGEYLLRGFKRLMAAKASNLNFEMSPVEISEAYSLTVQNLNLKKISGEMKSTITTLPGYGLLWKVTPIGLDMTGDFKTFVGNQRLKTGRTRLKAYRGELTAIIGMTTDADGMKSALDDCKFETPRVDMRVPLAERVINRHLRSKAKTVATSASEFLSIQLCEMILTELWPQIQPHIFPQDFMPMLHAEKDVQYKQDNRLVDGLVELDQGRIVGEYNGLVIAEYPNGTRLRQNPDQGWTRLPLDVGKSGRMMEIYISALSFATFFFRRFEGGFWNYDLQPGTTPAGFEPYLKTSCSEALCVGSLFPPLEEQFPGSQVGVDARVRDYPKFFAESGKRIGMEALMYMDLDLHTPTGVVDFVEASFSINVSLRLPRPSKDDQAPLRVSEIVDVDGFTMKSVSVKVPRISDDDVKFMISLVVDSLVKDSLKGSFMEGLHVPTLLRLPLLNPVASLSQGLYILQTDFCHPEECKVERDRFTTTPKPVDNSYDY